jgi:hypothetical protein
MGLFNNLERMNGLQAAKVTPPQPLQEIEMIVEYFDKTVERFSVTSNLEELKRMVSNSFRTGVSINFPSTNPPFSINPRWIKKVFYQTK